MLKYLIQIKQFKIILGVGDVTMEDKWVNVVDDFAAGLKYEDDY